MASLLLPFWAKGRQLVALGLEVDGWLPLLLEVDLPPLATPLGRRPLCVLPVLTFSYLGLCTYGAAGEVVQVLGP